MTTTQQKPENGFLNILFNILIPVLILNKGTKFIGPLWALIFALAFPLGYGGYDLYKRRKTNALSILGLANVGITGSLALAGIHGFWFAVKEAAFPLLVGLFVFGSAFTKKPFIEVIFLNPAVMNLSLIWEKLKEKQNELAFHGLLKNATLLLALSFVFSAICNFVLAQRIFVPIDSTLDSAQQSIIFNEQLSHMTALSMAVIMIPSILFLGGIFWYLIKGIQNLSGLKTDEIMQQK